RTVRAFAALATLSVFSLAGPPSAAAEDGPSAGFVKALRSYLEIQTAYMSYGDNVAYQAANETLTQIAASGVEITAQMQQIVLEEAQAKFGDKLRDLEVLTEIMTPVYAKHFDQKDMEGMVEFWSSPLGRKSLETSAAMNQETLGALQQITFGITPSYHLAIDTRFRELGIEMNVQPAPPSAPAGP
ncbi:MAG: DUF2059 domain-containing protein, partial [Myxococcota bacterium]